MSKTSVVDEPEEQRPRLRSRQLSHKAPTRKIDTPPQEDRSAGVTARQFQSLQDLPRQPVPATGDKWKRGRKGCRAWQCTSKTEPEPVG
jgi:hypothetical protein